MKKIMTIAVLMAMTVLGGQKVMASGAGVGYGRYLSGRFQEKVMEKVSRENIDMIKTEALRNHR
ncbi:hypothetical protein PM10SUCC1_04600 [Propionigenium maris DSM 9537]|uniref:Uncharacterized protein n=1 Tax=Propionigenium maris DSM 9537 TaxID=1123000 RepID=A0A9W6GJ62_9FUSO|nr:hypothetical protein [Propionigenium maris]GLI54945.1 hypothetical protein PM10SUCC1_04600 [Propionigenium maris DSM 9537]